MICCPRAGNEVLESGKRSTACQVTLQYQLKLVLTGLSSMLLPLVAALGITTLRDLLGRLYSACLPPCYSVSLLLCYSASVCLSATLPLSASLLLCLCLPLFAVNVHLPYITDYTHLPCCLYCCTCSMKCNIEQNN